MSYRNANLSAVALGPRTHDDLDTLLWCSAGRAEVTVGRRTVPLAAGDAILISAGVEHSVVTDDDTIMMPQFLDAAAPGDRHGKDWLIARALTPSAMSMLMASRVDFEDFMTVSAGAQQRVLHAQVRSLFSRGMPGETTPTLPASSAMIRDPDHAWLIWCVHGLATVTAVPGLGTPLREIALRGDQAVVVPAGLPHRISARQGGLVTRFRLDPATAPLGAAPRLIHMSTRLRAEALYRRNANTSDFHPTGWTFPYYLPSASPSDVELVGLPRETSAWRVQRIQRSLHDDPGRSTLLEDWAERLGVTRRSIELGFSTHTPFTFAEWRHELQMQRAISWLDEGRQAKWISHHLGYAHISAFSRAFKRHTGTSIRDHQAEAKETVIRLR